MNRLKRHQTPESATTVFSHRSRNKDHLVNLRCVLKQFNRVAETLGLSDGVQDINAGVAVAEATVVVGGDIQFMGVANLKKTMFGIVLVVDDDVAFNNRIVLHVIQFAPLL